jgi:ankyrin repeat protein
MASYVKKKDYNIQTRAGKTALHFSIESKNIMNTQELLSVGIDIHITNKDGLSAYDALIMHPSEYMQHIDKELRNLLEYYGASFYVRRFREMKLTDNPSVKITS